MTTNDELPAAVMSQATATLRELGYHTVDECYEYLDDDECCLCAVRIKAALHDWHTEHHLGGISDCLIPPCRTVRDML